MKEYVKLYVNEEAYYSGSTYYEELFLPLDVWRKIENEVRMYVFIHELDGKHSETQADIFVDYYDESQLKRYLPLGNDGDILYYYFDEEIFFEHEKFEDLDIREIQNEVHSLCEIEQMTITYNKQNKEKILSLLEGYIN